MNYAQQIKHPNWQKKRLEVLELHNFQCQECKAKDEELHVHHPFYKRGAMIWEYDKSELECLCFICHKNAHAIDEEIKKALAQCRDKKAVLNFIKQAIIPGAASEHRPRSGAVARRKGAVGRGAGRTSGSAPQSLEAAASASFAEVMSRVHSTLARKGA